MQRHGEGELVGLGGSGRYKRARAQMRRRRQMGATNGARQTTTHILRLMRLRNSGKSMVPVEGRVKASVLLSVRGWEA